MTNDKDEKKADPAEQAKDASEVNAGNMSYNTPQDAGPATQTQASRQRQPLAEVASTDRWFHDASHSADANRLRAQRERDEKFGFGAPEDYDPEKPQATTQAAKISDKDSKAISKDIEAASAKAEKLEDGEAKTRALRYLRMAQEELNA